MNPSRKPAAVRRAGGYLFLLAGFHLNYRHRTMRTVVCALWVLTTASCADAAASFTNLTWFPGFNLNYNTTGVSGDGSVVVGTSVGLLAVGVTALLVRRRCKSWPLDSATFCHWLTELNAGAKRQFPISERKK